MYKYKFLYELDDILLFRKNNFHIQLFKLNIPKG